MLKNRHYFELYLLYIFFALNMNTQILFAFVALLSNKQND